MDELHRAKLSAIPAHEAIPPPIEPTFRILPYPNPINPSDPNPNPNPQPNSNLSHSNPLQVPLPNIYITTPPPPPPAAPQPQPLPLPMPPRKTHKIGPIAFNAPHPLLWLCLLMSFLALILEVPKGSLPTLTGRHKNLLVQERLVQERLQLLTQLSNFLPPPLSYLVEHGLDSRKSLTRIDEYMRGHSGSRWSLNDGRVVEGERWWNVEDLGDGASIVKSKSDGGVEREVWVLKTTGDGEDESQKPLLSALTHSLILRDRLLSDLAALKSSNGAVQSSISGNSVNTPQTHLIEGRYQVDEEETRRVEEWRKRERENEVDEREREVVRREKWVVEEMRKLSDKVHSQATELTLEDRITERLKAYQRQLAQLHDEDAVI